jgi:AmmeMemoRadiSam system protein A
MNFYIELAKEAVERYVKERKIIEPSETLPKEFFNKKSGAFVTIKKDKELRGCIGTYLPTKENIAEEIIQNAIAAATEDYRFEPIKPEELSELSYIVYLLTPPKLVNNLSELNPKKYGIIVKTAPISFHQRSDVTFNGYTPPKSGLLLPDLEGVDTVEKQISIACQKAGINPGKEKIIIYKFTVEKYGE